MDGLVSAGFGAFLDRPPMTGDDVALKAGAVLASVVGQRWLRMLTCSPRSGSSCRKRPRRAFTAKGIGRSGHGSGTRVSGRTKSV